MNKLSNKTKNIAFSLILTGLAIFPFVSLAKIFNPTSTIPTTASTDVTDAINSVGNLVYGIFFAVAIISIILAAYNFVTAQGDPEKIKSARNYVIYALAGVLVATLAIGLTKLASSMAGQ